MNAPFARVSMAQTVANVARAGFATVWAMETRVNAAFTLLVRAMYCVFPRFRRKPRKIHRFRTTNQAFYLKPFHNRLIWGEELAIRMLVYVLGEELAIGMLFNVLEGGGHNYNAISCFGEGAGPYGLMPSAKSSSRLPVATCAYMRANW